MAKQDNSTINVLITGASGLIGSALAPFLIEQGYTNTSHLFGEWHYGNKN